MNCLICNRQISSNYRLCEEHNHEKEDIIKKLENNQKNLQLNIFKMILNLENNIILNKSNNNQDYLNLLSMMEFSRNIQTNKENYYSHDRIIQEFNLIKKLTLFECLNHDTRKKWPANIRCNDGHYVRSRAEKIIDDWLYENDVKHEYERTLFLDDKEYLPDFYLPKQKVYIEYYGLNDKNYQEHSKNKMKDYKNKSLNIITIYDKDIDNINDILMRSLKKYN